MKIIPYKPGSQSAKALALALGIKRIKHVGKPIRVKKTIINWGCSQLPDRVILYDGINILNQPMSIRRAANKLEAFKLLKGMVPLPEFTESRDEALKWLPESVVCRTVLNGHSGKGIVIAYEGAEIVPAPLYTRYVKKEHEYRIHVMNGKAFFVQRKARKLEVPDAEVNWQVRNHQNGFIYANKNIEVPELFKEIAVKAIQALNLDFGAVDLIVTKKGEPYVLEVNTAPGLSGSTLDKYCEQFKML